MTYQQTMQAVDTLKALKAIGLEGGQKGAYVYFPCECGKNIVIKAYGDKKNVFYCPDCKNKGTIISLVMGKNDLSYKEAVEFLEKKAIAYPAGKITKELSLEYELEYRKSIEAKGLPEELCKLLGIGFTKGKTMLSGCIVFTVRNENGIKVAYYGINVNNGKPIFHRSFNPELYLYNYDCIDPAMNVIFTTDMLDCARLISTGRQAVCNFGLPYLSTTHFNLLQKCKFVEFSFQASFTDAITLQIVKNAQNYYKFKVNGKNKVGAE